MPATHARLRATPSQQPQDAEQVLQILPDAQGRAASQGRRPLTARTCKPVQNRVPVLLVHIPKLSIRGQARLAAEVGVSRSTVSRLVNGRINPSYRLARGVTDALERFLGRPLDMRDVFSTDGTYLTASGCALCKCGGCPPEAAWGEDGTLKPEWRDARPAGRREWKGYNRPGGGGYDLEAVLPSGLAPRRVVAQIKQFDRTGALVAPVRLIDGRELLGLLIRHRLGVRETTGVLEQRRDGTRRLEIDEAFFGSLATYGTPAATDGGIAPGAATPRPGRRSGPPVWRVTVLISGSHEGTRIGRGRKQNGGREGTDTGGVEGGN